VRFILAGTLLCVLASTALAGEHYIEIWNPPEARAPALRPGASGKRTPGHHGAKHKLASTDRPPTRRVAEPALRAPAPVIAPATPGSKASPPNRIPEIPPQIGPDGNILQVNYRVPAAH
jgi:hypothetical protein